MSRLWLPGYDPGDASRFFLPEHLLPRDIVEQSYSQYRRHTRVVQGPFDNHIVQVETAAEARDLAYRMGGRGSRPTREAVLIGPDGKTPIVVAGLGVAEAAELEEVAIEAYEAWRPVDFDELRARNGLPSSKEAGEKIKEAIWERAQRHLKNPVTDPPRQPNKPKGSVAVPHTYPGERRVKRNSE